MSSQESNSNNTNSVQQQRFNLENDIAAQKEQAQRDAFFSSQEQNAFSVMRELIPNLQLLKMNFLQRVDVPLTPEEEEVLLGTKNENHMTSIRQMINNEQTIIKTAADLQRQGRLQFQTAADTGASLFEELQMISAQKLRSAGAGNGGGEDETPEQEFCANLTCVVLGRLQHMIQRINEEISLRWDAEANVRKEKLVPMDRLVDAVKCQRRELDLMRGQRDKLQKENNKLKSDLENTQFRLKRMTEHRYEDYTKFFKELQQVRRSKDQPRDNELFVVDNVVTENAATAHRIGAHQGNIRLLEVPLSVIVQHGDPDAKVPTNFGGKSTSIHPNDMSSMNASQQQQLQAAASVSSMANLETEGSVFDEQQDDTLLSFEDMATALKRSVELEKKLADFKFVEAMGIQNSGELISTLQHHQKRSQQMEDRNSKLSMQVDKLTKQLEAIKNRSNLEDKETDINGLQVITECEVQTEGQLSLVAENGVEAATETEITLMDSLTIIRSSSSPKDNNNNTIDNSTSDHQHSSLENTLAATTAENTLETAASPASPSALTASPVHGDTLILSESQFINLQKPETSEIHTQTWHAAYKHSSAQASVDMVDSDMNAVVEMFDNETQDDFYKIEIEERNKDLKRSRTYHNVVKEDLRLENTKTSEAEVVKSEALLTSADLIRRHGCSEESPIEQDLLAPCELGDAILMRLHGCDGEEPRYLEYWTPLEDNRPDENINFKKDPTRSTMRTALIRDLDHDDEENVGRFIRVGNEEERNEKLDIGEEVEVIHLHGCSKEDSRTKDYTADGKEVVDLSQVKVVPIPNECNGEAYRKLEANEVLDRVRFHTCENEEKRRADDQKENDSLLKPMNELSPESGRKLDRLLTEERFYDEAAENHKHRQEEQAKIHESRRMEKEEKARKEREEAMLRARILSELQREKEENYQEIEVQTDPIQFSTTANRPPSSSSASSPRQMLGTTTTSTSHMPLPRPASSPRIQQQKQTSSRVSTVSGFTSDDEDFVNPIDQLNHQRSISCNHGGKFMEIGIQTDDIDLFSASSNGLGVSRRENLSLSRNDEGANTFPSNSNHVDLETLRRSLLTIRKIFEDHQESTTNSLAEEKKQDVLVTSPTHFSSSSASLPSPSFAGGHQHHHTDSSSSSIPYFSATRSQREYFNQQLLQSMSSSKASKRRSAEIAKRNIESLNAAATKLDDAVLGAAKGVVLPAVEFLEKALDASSFVNSALADIYENSFLKDVKMQEAIEESMAAAAKAAGENKGDEGTDETVNKMNRHLVTGRDHSMLARARRNRKVAEAEVKCWDAMSQVQSTFTKVSKELQSLEVEFGAVGGSSPLTMINNTVQQHQHQGSMSTPSRVSLNTTPTRTTLFSEARSQLGPPLASSFSSTTTPKPTTTVFKSLASPLSRLSNDESSVAATTSNTTESTINNNNNFAKTPPPSRSLGVQQQQSSTSASASLTPINPKVPHHLPPLSESEMEKDYQLYFSPSSASSPAATNTNKNTTNSIHRLASNTTPQPSSLGDKMAALGTSQRQHQDEMVNKANNTRKQVVSFSDSAHQKMQSSSSSSLNKKRSAASAIDHEEAAQFGLAMVGVAAQQQHDTTSNNNNNNPFKMNSPQTIRSAMKKRLQEGGND